MSTSREGPEKINMLISINYKASDNSVGSSLYEDFLWVNLPFTEQLSVSIFDFSDTRECLF